MLLDDSDANEELEKKGLIQLSQHCEIVFLKEVFKIDRQFIQ